MAVPLPLVASLATRGYKFMMQGGKRDLFNAATVALGYASYLAYENVKDNSPIPPPVLPSSKPIKPLKKSLNPPVTDVLNPVKDQVKKNTDLTNSNLSNMVTKLASSIDSIKQINEGLATNAADSPFLQNMVGSKDSLDSISLNLEAQTILMGSIWETLENNLSALVAVKMVEAQNSKVLTDYQNTMAEKMDMGNFFYQFIPTSEYWSKVDEAQILFDSYNGHTTPEEFLPSRYHAAPEIELIDKMNGYYTNAAIRSVVEEYRTSKVSAGVRALIGQTALAQEKSKSETETKAREYYTVATQSINAKEVSSAVNNLVDAVAPIAGWAESAKVREDYLSTPIAVKDLDGNVIAANTAPMAVTVAKDAAIAREKTDIINLEFDSVDMPDMLDVFPLLNFFGRESVYSPSPLPSLNPFSPF